jgi:hypothetical protein
MTTIGQIPNKLLMGLGLSFIFIASLQDILLIVQKAKQIG